MTTRYIENDINKGIEIDWKLVRKEFKKLGIPKDVYNPLIEPWESCKYFFELSERSTGKTTNLILLGCVLYKLYGIIIHYIRTREEQISPKNLKDLMTTIEKFGYIEKLTDGKYNSCLYHARRWYYCNRDKKSGDILEQSSLHFMFCMSIDNNEMYKSSYTCSTADFIIYDEFISRYYYPDSFVLFLDICKTLIRSRLSPIIVLSANTIDKHSLWFDEFGIKNAISTMKIGDHKVVETNKGTRMSIRLMSIDDNSFIKKRNKNNSLFFGFSNPKLSAITGDDWSMSSVPRIPKEKHEIIDQTHYLKISNELVHMTLVKFEKLGYSVLCTSANNTYNDSIIYTLDDITDSRYRYGIGYTKLDNIIFDLYRKNKFYYSTNEVGAIVESYFNQLKRKL